MTIIDPHTSAAAALEAETAAICRATTEHLLENNPDIKERWTARAEAFCEEDCRFHLEYLGQAVDTQHPELFINYVLWVRTVLESYNVPSDDLPRHLESLSVAITRHITSADLAARITTVIMQGLEALADKAHPYPDVHQPAQLSSIARSYLEATLNQDREHAVELLTAAVASGIPLKSIYLDVLQPAQYEIGRLWQTNKITVAVEHYSTSLTQLVLGHLYSAMPKPDGTSRQVAIAACVAGEQHELGLRMVADFFHMDGWKAIYLGPNTPTSAIIATIKHHQPQVLALSATVAPHLQQLADLIRQARAADVPHMKILVGGHPFNDVPDLWKKLGADACANNAAKAVEWANKNFPEEETA